MSAKDYETLLEKLKDQEKTLQFTYFNCETALDLGMALINNAKAIGRPLTIDISKNGMQLFHYAFEGSCLDNENWIIRKNRVVQRFNKSSYYVGQRLESLGKTIEEKYGISSSLYAPYGGAFPIIIKNTGVIGSITVSGLHQGEDHDLVVNTIEEYLKKVK
ncbi:MAG: heme-degrading protein [Clostridiaceae bacterium]|jgi:uncharacterized protein (UPF0303 family)|nr:heme-degrading protein [Clostridiaceae bacterium]